jgi:hypothetical protein
MPVQMGALSFAALGLQRMMNAGGAVTSLSCTPPSESGHSKGKSSTNGNGNGNGNGLSAAGNGVGEGVAGATATVGVKGCGTFLLYCSHRPTTVQVNGLSLVPLMWEPHSGRLILDVPPVAAAGDRPALHAQLTLAW